MRRTIILAAALSIILLGLWGTAVIYFDESRLKGIASDRLSDQLGRRVEIVGVLRFSLFPRPRVDAQDVIVFGPEGASGPAAITADRASMRLRIAPLLRGELAPGEMQLSGAVIDLGRLESDGDGSDPLSNIRSSAKLLGGRSLRLEDVTLLMARDQQSGARRIAIDLIEFDRFSLDRTVRFRFRGNLGDPPVLDDLQVDALLYVPAAPEGVLRLREMRLHGRLAALDQAVTLTGELTATSDDPFRLALIGGRFQLGESAYDLSFNYHGGETPSADALVSGGEMDWLALNGVRAGRLNLNASKVLAAFSQRVDLRSQLQFDRLLIGPLRLFDARIDLRSRSDGMGLTLAAAFPGGLAEASGVLAADGSNSLAVDGIIGELGQLLESLGLPAVAGGSGEARLSLMWPGGGPGFLLEGQVGLWDGYLRIARGDAEPERREFDRFSGEIRLSPGYLELPGFELAGGDLAGAGWAAIELPDGNLGGEIRVDGAQADVLELSGTLGRPRLALPAAEDDSPADTDESATEETESGQ